MERIKVALIATLALFIMIACNGSDAQEDRQSVVESPTAQQPAQSNTETQSKPTQPIQDSVDSFLTFQNGIDSLGLTYEVTFVLAQMLGAERGYRYTLDDGRIELYEFDVNSEAFALVVQNKAITMEGFGDIPVVVAGNMAMIINDNISTYSDIIALFTSLFG